MAAVAPSPEAYHAAMIPLTPKQHTAAATDSLTPVSSGHSHHRAETMTPTHRRVSVKQSIPPKSNEHSLRRKEKMFPTRRRVLVKQSIQQSIPEATNSMIMSMETSEMSTPRLPSEMSMPTGTIGMSMPSLPVLISEMSMSMGTIKMSMPIMLSEMSVPMGTIEISMPMKLSEMSMPMGTIKMSMPILTSEMSMSMMGTMGSSMPILIREMSISMGMSEMSMPIELREMSMSMGTLEKTMSMELSEMSIPAGTIDMSMLIELSEIIMSMGTSEMSMPVELIETSMSITHNDEVSASPTSRPTSPMTSTPTTSSPVATVAPTRSHSASPLPGVISVETNTQLQLIGMYAKMDVKASDVFKQSCDSFLEEYMAEAQPPIFTVNCEVTKQQLLSGRRLRAGRGLEEESSLLVDVSVEGNANATKTAMKAPNIHFNDQVIETFVMHSSQFVEQLQEDGIEAGVHAFDRLTSTLAYPTGGDVSEIVKSPDGSEDSESNGKMGQNLAIATMTVSGIVIVGVFALFFYRVRNNASIYDESSESESSSSSEVNDAMFPCGNNESIYDESSESESSSASEVDDVMSPCGSVYSADKTEKCPDMTPIHAGEIAYKYSLEDGLVSPETIVSHKPFSPMNVLDLMKGEELLSTNRKKVNVIAPPGKLGIIIDTCSEGPRVHSIKGGSSLEGLIVKGDLILAVDDEDTTEWSAHYLTKLVAKKSNMTRKITVLRTEMFDVVGILPRAPSPR